MSEEEEDMPPQDEIRRSQLRQIVGFLHVAERLKQELRHSWLSDDRRESVAEHSWRLALMVMVLAPGLDHGVDIEKCLKMALLHDLAEAETGDIPVFECPGNERKEQKYVHEKMALMNITSKSGETGREIGDLWEEYEHQKSYEARFVRALDKVEA